MWWSKAGVAALLLATLSFSLRPALAAEVCPGRAGQVVHFVDVFDGSPEQLATLVPDKAWKSSGYWRLGYVYDAGRFVTVRCKYADGTVADVKLSTKVHQCDYKIDAQKSLKLNCH
jgi:hypothetical protein